MSVERFRELCKDAYDLDEALERQKLEKKSVELLRSKLKTIKSVPKFLVDNQVGFFYRNTKTIHLYSSSACTVFEFLQRRHRCNEPKAWKVLWIKKFMSRILCKSRRSFGCDSKLLEKSRLRFASDNSKQPKSPFTQAYQQRPERLRLWWLCENVCDESGDLCVQKRAKIRHSFYRRPSRSYNMAFVSSEYEFD